MLAPNRWFRVSLEIDTRTGDHTSRVIDLTSGGEIAFATHRLAGLVGRRFDAVYLAAHQVDGGSQRTTFFDNVVHSPPAEDTGGFRRGDSNADGTVDVSDPITSLSFQFLGVAPDNLCLDATDFNDDGKVDVSDPIGSLSHQFLGLAPPPEPGKEQCGPDPTPDDRDPSDPPGGPDDELGCGSYPPEKCLQ